MKLTFTKYDCFSEDAFTVRRCYEGQTREVADTAARACISRGTAYETNGKSFNEHLRELLSSLRIARNNRKSA